MEIKIGNYTIHSDSMKNLWIMEKSERIDEKSGKTIVSDNRVAGFVNNFEDLYKDFVQKQWYDSKADSVLDAIETLMKVQAQVNIFIERMTGNEVETEKAGD